MNNKDFANKIINNGRGSIVLIYEDGSAYHLEGMFKGEFTDEYFIDEDCYVDREYMRNTKIRVENEEHWNFVQKLLFNMDISWFGTGKEIHEYNSDAFLQVDEDFDLLWDRLSRYDECTLGEVILPMKEVVATEESVTENSEGEEEEWPRVGDEVSLRYKYDSKKIHLTGKLEFISDKHLIVDNCYKHRGEYDIEKPVTPEEDLKAKLIDITDKYRNEEMSIQEIIAKATINGEISGLSYRKEG